MKLSWCYISSSKNKFGSINYRQRGPGAPTDLSLFTRKPAHKIRLVSQIVYLFQFISICLFQKGGILSGAICLFPPVLTTGSTKAVRVIMSM